MLQTSLGSTAAEIRAHILSGISDLLMADDLTVEDEGLPRRFQGKTLALLLKVLRPTRERQISNLQWQS